MLFSDSTSVCKEYAMVCTELQYEDADEHQIVYGDQGINAEVYVKAMYGDLMKPQSEEVKCTVAQRANNSVVFSRVLGLTALNSLLQYVNWLVWEFCSVN